jgi:hypothetical protein
MTTAAILANRNRTCGNLPYLIYTGSGWNMAGIQHLVNVIQAPKTRVLMQISIQLASVCFLVNIHPR